MKNIYVLLLLAAGFANAQIVTIPDPVFKARLIFIGVDTNLDGEIQNTEAEAVIAFNSLGSGNGSGITDLTGIQAFTNLERLVCMGMNLTTLNVSGMPSLQLLECSGSGITSLDASNLPSLTELIYDNNPMDGGINIVGSDNIEWIHCPFTQQTQLDLSNLSHLLEMNVSNNQQLTYLNIKNGSLENMFFLTGVPNLAYVCIDEIQETNVYPFNLYGSAATFSTFCSFVPGGDYNTITGTVLFDDNNNGCDASDLPLKNVRLNITDNIYSNATVVSALGNYTLYSGAGDYDLMPNLENPVYFTISPAMATVSFPTANQLVTSQNFCITANGVHPDLEIILVPLNGAVAGFNSNYKIVYKNKGNQTQSGSINLTFNDAVTDLIVSNPVADNQAENSLLWNYIGLRPFEIRDINFTLNVNSPTETPPINAGDVLAFTAIINFAAGDETPEDNVSELYQVVRNAYDPNDKSCLEGNTVSPENIGKYLHYNINFENIGSAEATNIVVLDRIDTTQFEINSLQLLYASHAVDMKITGNKVEFVFENINLPIGGHGNVLFKIKTLPTLTIGDEVSNTANIFFDYNAPIDTNEARTAFNNLSKSDFVKDNSVTVYPNPAKNKVTVKATGTIKSVQLYDVQGRILQTIIEDKNQVTIDLSMQLTGIYFVTVTTLQGSSTQKIIKQ